MGRASTMADLNYHAMKNFGKPYNNLSEKNKKTVREDAYDLNHFGENPFSKPRIRL